jgi:hypothetical protein
LESIGLIQFQNLGYQRTKLPRKFQVSYYGRLIALELPNETDNVIEIGHTVFTHAGKELVQVCGSTPIDGFFEYISEKWMSQGYIKKEEPPENIQQSAEAE